MQIPYSEPITPVSNEIEQNWRRIQKGSIRNTDQLTNLLKDKIYYFNQHDLPYLKGLYSRVIDYYESKNPTASKKLVKNIFGIFTTIEDWKQTPIHMLPRN